MIALSIVYTIGSVRQLMDPKVFLKMIQKLIQLEQKLFTAPYRWLLKQGVIVTEKIYLTISDLYDKTIVDEYRGNPNWPGDD